MSGSMRRILNLGVYDGLKRVYSLRRLDLSKIQFFHPTAEETAAHGKVLPTLTPAKARATDRKRTGNTSLSTAAAEAAAPKMDHPKPELVMRPPQLPHSLDSYHFVNFFPTASESKVVFGDRGKRMVRFDVVHGSRYIDTLPCLHEVKDNPVVTSVPPTDTHLRDGEDTGDLYIIDGILHPDKAEVRPQFEALVWRGLHRHPVPDRSWHCDILPLPPWISHHPHALVRSHALVGDTICFSVFGAWGFGTYCFHTATREWTKAGDWVMPFHGKADYDPELGLWFGVSDNLPCAADLSGVLRGEEPLEDKIRIWAHDDLPQEWQRNEMCSPSVVSLGSGRFILVDFLDAMKFDKEENEMSPVKQFALFTGMEVAYSNGKAKNGHHNGSSNGSGNDNGGTHVTVNENGVHNDGTNGSGNENGKYSGSGNENGNYDSSGNENGNYNSSGNENGNKNGRNGVKGKNIMRGLRMIKHKSGRYLFNNQQRIQAVF